MVKKRSDGYGILISERPVRAEGSVFSAKVILFHDLSKRYAAFFCRCAGARATESAILCYPVLTDAFARVWGSGGIGMPFIILRLEGNHWPEMITFAAFVIHIKCCANIIFWSKLQGEVPCMF